MPTIKSSLWICLRRSTRPTRRFVSVVAPAIAFLLVATAASAAPIIYFGEDLGLGEGTVLPATPNADAAQFAFLAGLIDPGLETFEGIAAGTTAPFAINFANGVTATVTGAGTVVSLADGVAAAGRYGVTGDADADERYLDTGGGANAFVLTFSQPVSAFGFFGIDIGDFNGQVTATTAGGLNQIFNIGNTIAGEGGGVLFWGVIDPAQTFTSIAFGNTGSGADFFGFDDFTIGSPEQVRVIPEPATLSLLGIGLATAAIRRRRLSRR